MSFENLFSKEEVLRVIEEYFYSTILEINGMENDTLKLIFISDFRKTLPLIEQGPLFAKILITSKTFKK